MGSSKNFIQAFRTQNFSAQIAFVNVGSVMELIKALNIFIIFAY
jgi:hypothetical protein